MRRRRSPPASPAGGGGGRSFATTLRAEKGFEPIEGDPFDYCLGLNIERAPGAPADEWPNGGLIEMTAAELDRLDLRELRYDRVDVTGDVRAGEADAFEAVFTYTAKPENFAPIPRRAPSCSRPICGPARPRSRSWARTSWSCSGAARTRCPVPVVEARLVRDEIPEGNPRAW